MTTSPSGAAPTPAPERLPTKLSEGESLWAKDIFTRCQQQGDPYALDRAIESIIFARQSPTPSLPGERTAPTPPAHWAEDAQVIAAADKAVNYADDMLRDAKWREGMASRVLAVAHYAVEASHRTAPGASPSASGAVSEAKLRDAYEWGCNTSQHGVGVEQHFDGLREVWMQALAAASRPREQEAYCADCGAPDPFHRLTCILVARPLSGEAVTPEMIDAAYEASEHTTELGMAKWSVPKKVVRRMLKAALSLPQRGTEEKSK